MSNIYSIAKCLVLKALPFRGRGLLLLTGLLFCSALVSFSQSQISRGEYYIDTDPGPGNGISIITALADTATDTISIATGSLSFGYHMLYIRYVNESGMWGTTTNQLLYVIDTTTVSEPPIAKGEYFVDTDPGVGNGTSFTAVGADSTTDSISIATGSLAAGYHTLYIRYKNDSDMWGNAFSRLFNVIDTISVSEPPIAKGEYFVDTDPGAGNGTSFTASGTDSATDSISVATAALAAGYHMLYIRYKNDSGMWGNTFNELFNVIDTATVSEPPIAKGEYFVDTDPGAGNGTAFTAVGVDSATDSISIATGALAFGYHMLYIRYENASGMWGNAFNELFYVIDTATALSPSITAGEYFVDTDPGVGNGTGFTSSGPDSSTNSITIATGSLTAGGHTAFTRYRDSLGKWGQTQASVFYVCTTPIGPITGTTSTCPEGTIALSDTTAGTSHSWSSSNTSVATVGSTGVVTGVAAGIATISYTVAVACGTVSVVTIVTVNPLLIAGTITGSPTVCASGTTALSDAASGGTWQTSNTSIAVVNSSGIVSGANAGSVTISYSVSNSCGTSIVTHAMTVNPLPTGPVAITGAAAVCIGLSTTLGDGTSGGTWSSGNTSRATVNGTGSVYGIASGSVTISYTVTNGCGSSSVTDAIAVDSTPVVPAIAGATVLCASATTALSDGTGDGSWSSSNTTIATISSGGILLGAEAGIATITYTVTNVCTSTLVTTPVTINPLPATPAAITGTLTVCTESSVSLSDGTTGGTWSSNNNTVATAGSTGAIWGAAAGSATISYTITNSCGSNAATTNVTVVPSSPASISGGTAAFCLGTTVTLSDATSGGSWSSSNTSIATAGSMGIVTGTGEGNAVITYTITNYCGTSFSTNTVTVDVAPANAGAITGPTAVCPGSTAALADSIAGGTWSVSNGSATIGGTGVVFGITAGAADTVTYTVSNICGAISTTRAIGITALPVAGIIAGSTSVCISAPSTLTDAVTGGVWTSLNPGVAAVGSSTGLVSGIYPGLAIIEYAVNNGCSTAVTAETIIVNPYTGTISGPTSVTAGATVTMTETVTGGTWGVSNSTVATINSSGAVTGLALGTTTISYTVSGSCGTASVTKPFAVGYCIPAHDSSSASILDGRFIARFVFAGLADTLIDFSSPNGTNNYEDFSATLTAYAAVNSTVVCGIQDSMPYPATGSAQVYIDFNNDQIFEASESVGGLNPVNSVLAAFPVTIPPYSDTGFHRMRVIFSYGNGAYGGGTYPGLDPCAVSLYGDVRDYSIDIENYPFFPGGSPRNIRACMASATPIDSLLSVYNQAAGQTEQWTILSYPFHGTLSGFPATMTSTGGLVTPTGLSYTGAFGYSGNDQFSVRVYDGRRYTDATINVTDGLSSITGAFVIDTATSIILTDAVPGGTWSSSNTAVATIDSTTGLATAQLINGVAIITYSLTDSVCGIISTTAELPVVAELCFPTFIDAPQSKVDGVSLEGLSITGELGTSINDAVPSNGTDNYENLNATYSVTLARGTNYQVSFSGNSSESVQAWIDYNNDGVYQTSEIVGGGTWPYPGQDSIRIGKHVLLGTYRMRIVANAPSYPIHDTSGRYYPSITPCSFDNVYYGDGRDYTVVIDSINHPPHFAREFRTPSLTNICENSGPFNIDSMLAITDIDSGQTETWSIVYAGNGTFGGFSETSISNSGLVVPSDKTYQPDPGFHGYDTFIVQVSDGFATDIITIGLHVGLPDSGTIYVAENGCAPDSNAVYTGYTCMLLGDYIGNHLRWFDQVYPPSGVWSSSNTSVATIDSLTGWITGVSVGTATMTFTATNSCGTTYTTYDIRDINPPVVIPCTTCTPPPPPPAPGIGCSSVYFVNGWYQTLNTCEGETQPINSLMTLNDPNPLTQTEVWYVGAVPTHGTLGGFNDTMTFLGSPLTPSGMTYTPDSGYTGYDAFTIYATNGICGPTWTYVRVLIGPYPGVITGDSVFAIGSTDTLLHDDQPDGIWTSSDYGVAGVSIFSIGGNGILSFVSTGTSVITYTVDNGCGEASTTHPIRVDNDNLYLRGRYLELGMAPNGSFGSTLDAPTSYHANAPEIAYWDPEACYSDTSFRKIGMTYDYGHAGWNADSPAYFGDYVIYGVPQEGWSVSMDGITSNAFNYNYQSLCSGYTGWFNAPNSHNAGITTGAGTTTANWQGRIDSADRHFAITQTTRLDTNASWVFLTTKIVNNGVNVNNVFFNRMINPKNDVGEDGSFITTNAINSRPWRTMVSAHGTVYYNAYIGLVTEDSRTKSYIIDSGILTIDSLAKIWLGESSYLLSGRDTAAAGMGVIFNLGTINAGDSVSFTYAYIFNDSTGADSVFPDPTIYAGGVTYADTAIVTICGSVSDSILSTGVNNGGAYTWNWLPITGLSADTGVTNGVALADIHGTQVYTISGTSKSRGDTVQRKLYLIINSTPPANSISGSPVVCAGATTTLADTVSGGSWSTSNTGVALVNAGSGVVTGITAGVDTIHYSVSNGCGATATAFAITVNPLPNAGTISGTAIVTAGSTITLVDATSGGSWSSTNTTVATVNSSGVVSGLTSGITTISYAATNGCGTVAATQIVTVNPSVSAGAITGTPTVCAGFTTALVDIAIGGVWSSTNAGVATIGTSGVVSGLMAGTTTISYTVTGGSMTVAATQVVTVNPLPNAGTISGTTTTCPGSSTTLNDITSGGAWSSTNPSVATVGSTGIVSGLTSGTTTISYTVTNSCGTAAATDIVTVNPAPNAGTISGTAIVTAGTTTALTDATPGGSWSSTNMTVATVGATGIVSGLAAGTTTISYTATNSCGTIAATVVVTVNATSAGAITGTPTVCAGFTTALADIATGGVWSSTNAGVATVGTSGVVSGLTAGTTTISYTVTGGSMTIAATQVVTVNPLPNAGTISGTTTTCPGSSTTLNDITSGGAWSSTNPSVATVGSTGIVSGLTSGTTTISYTVTNSCGTAAATDIVTVNPAPNAGTISGTAIVTAGATTALTDATPGGSWSSTNMTVATVGATGIVSGLAAGTTTISYTATNSCGTIAATVVVTVNATSAGAITGTPTVCAGFTTALADIATGGVWSSTNAGVATVGTSGVVSGLTAGTTTISYTVTGGSMTVAATQVVTVNPLPNAGTISGTTTTCPGSSTTLNDITSGGAWSSTNPSVATVGSTGIVSGLTSGTTTIFYTVTNSCGTAAATDIVTVNPAPNAGTISGTAIVTAGATTALTDATPGGSWSSTNMTVATVGATGIVSGLAAGTTTISYTATNSCGTIAATVVVTVNATSAGTITGTPTVCAGFTTALADIATGGVWSSTNAGVATVGTSGVVSGLTAGTTTISYTVTGGSMTVAATRVVTVNPLPNAGTISGTTTTCPGSSTTLNDITSGGAWSSTNPSVATVGSTGIVSGLTSGTTTISYTVTNSCGTAAATDIVTVNPAPNAGTISGTAIVTAGATTALTDATPGGSWSSTNMTVATVGATGIVSGLAAGTTTISYTATNSCGTIAATVVVTVNATSAGAITGTPTVCAGFTTALADIATGGVWSSTNAGVATVGTSGVVSGLTAGTTTISYTVTGGSMTVAATRVVTVNPLPNAGTIGGTATACPGSSVALTDATSDGVWSSTNIGVATVGTTGVVSCLTSGTTTISYTVTNSCGTVAATRAVTVNTLPAISGIFGVCETATTTLTDATSGGHWSSCTATVASVGSITGIVTGVATGTAVITYTLTTGCSTAHTFTVNASPATISGVNRVCAGSTTTLSDCTAGGTWSSSSTTIATAGLTTGVVTGIVSGTATITYRLSDGCNVTTPITVNAAPSAISGTFDVCGSEAITLTDATGGGHWSSGTTTVATICSTTGTITGVTTGTTVITYELTETGCIATHTFTVNAGPSAITGPDRICEESTITLSNCTADTWASGTTAIATIDRTTGVLTGVASGVAIITYRLVTGCFVTTSVTVNPVPAEITGTTTLTIGATTTLACTTPGGTWRSGSTTIATVESPRCIVHGVGDGTATISYTCSTGCVSTKAITVGSCRTGYRTSNTETASASSDIQVVPNPNKGIFTIKGTLGTTDDEVSIKIVDLLGQVVYSNMIIVQNGVINEQVQLSSGIANGMYMLNLHSASENSVFHIVIEQ